MILRTVTLYNYYSSTWSSFLSNEIYKCYGNWRPRSMPIGEHASSYHNSGVSH